MTMMHGDDAGMVFPPLVAPVQIVIMPIGKDENVFKYAEQLYNNCKKTFRTVLDNDSTRTPGARFYHWEKQGVPIRLEIGRRDLDKDVITLYRRDTREKRTIPLDVLQHAVTSLLEDVQENLYRTVSDIFNNLYLGLRKDKVL